MLAFSLVGGGYINTAILASATSSTSNSNKIDFALQTDYPTSGSCAPMFDTANGFFKTGSNYETLSSSLWFLRC